MVIYLVSVQMIALHRQLTSRLVMLNPRSLENMICAMPQHSNFNLSQLNRILYGWQALDALSVEAEASKVAEGRGREGVSKRCWIALRCSNLR